MSIEKIRAQVVASLWQGIAQSGVDLSMISTDQQEKLIGKLADQVMVTMDSLLEDEQPKAEPVPLETDETILWRGRPFLSLVESYVITSDRLKVVRGFLSRNIENFELIRVQDIDFKQGIHERVLKIGDIIIQGADPSHSKIILRNVPKPEEVYELLRKSWLEARKRHGLQFREFM
jgi:hypothetical protein